MNPAPSLIVFTVFSGLGFGLLAFLGVGFGPGTTDLVGTTAFGYLLLAFLLAGAGLAASTFHLGNPQRALRAFTQWRTSWLSREAWLAVITLLVMGLYGLFAVFSGMRIGWLGWLGALLALATVFATSMIYAQLKTVPRWNHWTTPVLFVLGSLAGGAMFASEARIAGLLAILLGGALVTAWRGGDQRLAASGTSLSSATGLGSRGRVRAFEPPHTGTNYLLKEMVHKVARKHRSRLRVIALGLASVVPAVILLLIPLTFTTEVVAILLHIAGMLAARWLFFAEAEHVVGFYYGQR